MNFDKSYKFGFNLVWDFFTTYTVELFGGFMALMCVLVIFWVAWAAMCVFIALILSLASDAIKAMDRAKRNTNKGKFREH